MAPTDSRVGKTILGRYQLVRQLGDGGMGAVYKAADSVLRRFVAVKLLHATTAQNPSAVERFVREARAAASIGHPNIIDILDFGMDEGRPYLVMEYLRGRSLSQAIAHESPFSLERACRIATHSLSGLAAAHDRGILHRDLKPANLMLISEYGDRDFVKLCDFGFATLLSPKTSVSDGKSLTPARTLVGTPAYAAPERLRGDDRPDPRIDVYSIGVVLFEMLAGKRPFDAPTFSELSQKVKTQPAPRLRTIRPDVPTSLDDVIQRALAKQREDRFATAEEFAAALVPFGGRRVQSVDDSPSDSFTMDILRLRARESQRMRASSFPRPEPRDAARVSAFAPSVPAPPRDAGGSSEIQVDVEIADDDDVVSTNDLDVHALHGATLNDSRARHSTTHADVHIDSPGVTPSPSTQAALDSPVRSVRGVVVLALMQHVARRFSARGLKEVLATLPSSQQPIFQSGITDQDWVPFDAYAGIQTAVDARFGRDDMQLLVQCGRAAAEGAVPILRSSLPNPPTPELMLVEMPHLLAGIVHGLGMRVRSVGRGYGSLELVDASTHELSTCVSMLGFVERCFGECAVKELEVNSVSCRALGDAQCVLDFSWLV